MSFYAPNKLDATGGKPVIPEGDFPIGVEKLMEINRQHDLTALKEFGGASSLWLQQLHSKARIY